MNELECTIVRFSVHFSSMLSLYIVLVSECKLRAYE